jgi:hypothetical protein
MNREMVARELVRAAEEIVSADEMHQQIVAAEVGGRWMTADEVREICPACADKMASMGITRIREAALITSAMTWDECIAEAKKKKGVKDPEKLCGWLKSHGPNASVASDKTAQWGKLPKGWTEASLKSFWGSMVGEVKHKVTKCIDKMKGTEIDDPGAFCASLADRIEGKGWRSER